jgi:tetratricopeptide (TPR) repeat protein
LPEDSVIDKNKILKEIQKFVAKSQWDKAIEEYAKLVKDSPNDTNSHNAMGDLYLKKNNPDKAVESYTKAADIFAKSGFTLKAIALYKKIQNIKPNQVDVLITLGKLNAERGLIGNANESFLAAASYFSRQGQKGKAIEVYKTLCDLNPDNLSLAQKLAELYLSEGYDKEAVSKYIELAETSVAKGDLAEARGFLEKAETKGSDRFDFIRVSAMLDLKSNKIPEAIKKLEHARDIDPTDTRIGLLLSESYQRSGRYEECGAILSSIVEKDPNNLQIRKQLSDVYVKAGDYQSAWQHYDYIIERNISNNQLQEAERLIKEYLVLKPEDIAARHLLVSIYSKTGQEKETDEVHEEIAELYQKSGETLKAENIYRKLLEKDPANERLNEKLASIVHGTKETPLETPEAALVVPLGEEVLPEDKTFQIIDEDLPETQAHKAILDDISAEEKFASAGDTSLYDLPELTEDLDDFADIQNFDVGGSHEDEEAATAGNIIEIPDEDLGEIEDLDIFSTADDSNAVTETVEAPVHAAPDLEDVFDLGGAAAEEELFHVQETAPINLEEQLAEVDVYIKYGLTNKASEALERLEIEYPGNINIKEKYIDLFKSQGDIEGFVGASMELADLYQSRNDLSAAKKIIEKALEMDTGNENLKVRLFQLSGPSGATVEPEEMMPSISPAGFEFEPGIQEEASPDAAAGYSEDISEADFYVQQGLRDEARRIYIDILKSNPNDFEVKAKLEALEAPEVTDARPDPDFSDLYEPEPESAIPSAAPEVNFGGGVETSYNTLHEEFDAAYNDVSLSDEPVKQESDFFDLAAELQDELDENITKAHSPSEVFSDKQLESVFQEFKRGVEEQLNKEDYETHYNLGIAYKEMGMLDEALSEFGLAAKDPSRSLDCASMLGLCFIEKGDYDKAAEYFKTGINMSGHTPEEYMGLKYDLATAYELKGDLASAQSVIEGLVKEGTEFRDIKDRLRRLNKALVNSGASPVKESPKESTDETKNEPDEPKPAKKKSRVSYL